MPDGVSIPIPLALCNSSALSTGGFRTYLVPSPVGAGVTQELAGRTQELINGLMKLATPSEADPERQVVTVEAIKARKMGTSMQVFLYNLAKAEGVLDG